MAPSTVKGSKTQGSSTRNILLTIANVFIPLSILVFATGFFPYKPFLPGLAQFEELDYGPPPEAPFDKIVFMVVDALRSDFVFSEQSGFQYTQQLIRDGSAIPFTANARSPTVTMPRIKAITTGSIPSFVDLILNFDEGDTSSTLAVQDTWLAQLKAADRGKLLMFGDDTWLKLFPSTFDREDGTTSFFVADFTEVDHNVTRNIAGELENDDWSLMVLHYLGLDHIGHKAGPRSPNMIPKQREMDSIVKTLYESMASNSHLESTLLVLCGDHGMNDAGNHGASSPGETSPALVFLSPKLKDVLPSHEAPAKPGDEFDYYTRVEQSDLAPTIAALLGIPVSRNNLGAFIPDFLPFWPNPKDQVQILVRNARQILDIVTAAFGTELFDPQSTTDPCTLERTQVNELACDWRRISRGAKEASSKTEVDQKWLTDMSRWLGEAQDLMSSMASNYDMSRLTLGQGLAVAAVSAALIATMWQSSLSLSGLTPLLIIGLSYGVMMFASSYVEEEQHFWYWASTLWLAYLGACSIQRTRRWSAILWTLLALASLRLIRSWNQTGQKFAGEPDIVKIFLLTNPLLLWLLVSITYITVSFYVVKNLEGLPYVAITGITSVLVSAAFSFKLAFTAEDAPELVVGIARTLHDHFQGHSLLLRARIVFAVLALLVGVGVFNAIRGGQRASRTSVYLIHHLYIILAITQSRVTNIPLLLLSHCLFYHFSTLPLTIPEITTTSVLLQYATFFAFGGSNAISSVDLSSAYNGIGGFNLFAVGFLTLVSNWAGSIYWTSATTVLLLEKHRWGKTGRGVWGAHVTGLTIFSTLSVAFVMAACTALRTHLFIWTVFSPKYLYCMAWSLGQHLLINLGFGSALFWVGTRGQS